MMSDEPAPDVSGDERLMSLVERIRQYVRADLGRYTPDVQREAERIEAYIERGHKQFDRLLQRHAEFDAWLAERSENNA